MKSQAELTKQLNIAIEELNELVLELAITPRVGGDRNKQCIYSDYDCLRIIDRIKEKQNHSKQTEWQDPKTERLKTESFTILPQLADSSVLVSTQELESLLGMNRLEFQGLDCFTWHNFLFSSTYKISWEVKVIESVKLDSYSALKDISEGVSFRTPADIAQFKSIC